MTQAVYLYGVLEQEDIAFDIDGVADADSAYTIDHRTLSGVVSDIDTLDPEETDENVEAHHEVVNRLLEHEGGRTIVPMQFGMAFKSNRTLKNVLRSARPMFTRALRDIDGRVELGVKVVTEEETTIDEASVRQDVTARLEPLSEASTRDDNFSQRLVMNRSYLVERDRRPEFDRTVEELENDYGELIFKYSGPWAPYNFVDIRIGRKQ